MEKRTPLALPLLVLVSGTPGSGKTTLAKLLAQKMGLYHVERDTLKFGIEFTARTDPKDRKKTVVPIYWEVIYQLLTLRISCIADGSHYKGETEKDLERLGKVATVLNLHCQAAGHHERLLKREAARGNVPAWEKGYTPDFERMYKLTNKPLEHGYQTLIIDTTDGYQPSIERVATWIEEQI
jgi:predicted kinase